MAELWHQQAGETDQAYIRFLFYLNLGPTRSLQKAYQAYMATNTVPEQVAGTAGAVVQPGDTLDTDQGQVLDKATKSNYYVDKPGLWTGDSARHSWVKRAAAYDVATLTTTGQQVILNFYNALNIIMEKSLKALQKAKFNEEDLPTLLNTVQMVGQYISPEAIEAWQAYTPPGDSTDDTIIDQ